MEDRSQPAPESPTQILDEWHRLERLLADVVEDDVGCERIERRIGDLRRAYLATLRGAGTSIPSPSRRSH